MFSVGDKVVYKTDSVCIVESIETPAFVKDKEKKYYKLKSLFSKGNEVAYVPVDSDVSLRAVVAQEEAVKHISGLKNLAPAEIDLYKPALTAYSFQDKLRDCTAESMLRVFKYIIVREKSLEETGKKIRQVEERYLAIVEKVLSEEFALALGKEPDEIKALLRQNAVCD